MELERTLDSTELGDLEPFISAHGADPKHYLMVMGEATKLRDSQNLTFQRVRATRYDARGHDPETDEHSIIDLIDIHLDFDQGVMWTGEIIIGTR